MKYIKTYKIFESDLELNSVATEFINHLSKFYDLRLGKIFNKDVANCAWFTKEFSDWSKSNDIDSKFIYFDSDTEAHIAPFINNKVLDFTVKQFTKNPDDNYLILSPEEYKKFGYNNFQILNELPKDLTIREAKKLSEVNSKLYEQISESDFSSRQDKHSDEPISQNDLLRIRNFVSEIKDKQGDGFGWDLEMNTKNGGRNLEFNITDYDRGTGHKRFIQSVYKTEDEWFYVKEYYYFWYKSERFSGWRQKEYKTFKDSQKVYESYFKCDTIDGLFEFLNDRLSYIYDNELYVENVNESYHNEEIDKQEYKELLGGTFDPLEKKVLLFTQNEISHIKELTDKLGLSTLVSPSLKHINIFHRNTPVVMIEKIEDEWYLLSYVRHTRYWKCDTFVGLMKELKRYLD